MRYDRQKHRRCPGCLLGQHQNPRLQDTHTDRNIAHTKRCYQQSGFGQHEIGLSLLSFPVSATACGVCCINSHTYDSNPISCKLETMIHWTRRANGCTAPPTRSPSGPPASTPQAVMQYHFRVEHPSSDRCWPASTVALPHGLHLHTSSR